MSEIIKYPPGTKMLRMTEVVACTGISRSSIYARLDPKSPRYDPTFPIQIQLGPATVAWLEADILAWLASKPSSAPLASETNQPAGAGRDSEVKVPSRGSKKDLSELDDQKVVDIAIVRQLLESKARTGECISYQELMTPFRLWADLPADRAVIDKILEELTRESHSADTGLFGVLVHEKVTMSSLPSPAFFDLAKSLGYTYAAPVRFVNDQLERLIDSYESPEQKKRIKGRPLKVKGRRLTLRTYEEPAKFRPRGV